MPEIDLVGEDWENKFVPNVLGGLVLNQNSESMQQNQFLTLRNLIHKDGDMEKDTGYKDFGDIPSGAPGKFQKVFKHKTAAGAVNTFAVSRLTFFILSGTKWHIVSNGTATTIDLNVLQNDTVIPVADTTGFSVNDTVGLELDDGSYHISTIASIVAGDTITINDAVPSAPTVVATSGNDFKAGVTLAGTADKHVFGLTVPWNDALVFTNGVDKPQYYDPATLQVQVVPNLPSSGNTICESVALFDTSLVLIRTIEGGAQKNQRLRWSDKADFTEWVTGDAGSIDLLDSEDAIQNALLIGPYLAIYREKSIYRGTVVNTVSKRFQWDRMVPKVGALSPASIVDIGDRHFVVGPKETYIYKGGFDIDSIGDPIEKLLYGVEAELDVANAHKTFCIYVEALNDVLIVYETAAATTSPDKTLRWVGDLGIWVTREFADELIGTGISSETNTFTWNDLVGDWISQTWKWSSSSVAGTLNTLLLCAEDGQVEEYDFMTADDDGSARTYEIETPDFSHQNGRLRTDYIEFKCAGTSIKVEASLDAGVSWTTIETISPGAALTKVRVYKQFNSETIRYRLSGSGTFKLSWFNIRVTLESEN